jgi:hypothetical protein
MFGCHCQKSCGHSCKVSYLGRLFCSISLQICFCTSTMLFLLLLLCSIFRSRILWYFNLCCIDLVLLCLFTAFCADKWTLRLIFQSLWRMLLEFW